MSKEVIVSDLNGVRCELLPLTYTRPVGALRVGIDTLAEKWGRLTGRDAAVEPEVEYLESIFGSPRAADGEDALRVAADVIADAAIVEAVEALPEGHTLCAGDTILARRGDGTAGNVEYAGEVRRTAHLYDIFLNNGDAIKADFAAFARGVSQPLSATNTVIGSADDIFIAEGAKVEGAFINTTAGPVYIGPDAEVMEGSMLRGP